MASSRNPARPMSGGHNRQPWGFDFDRVTKPLLERGIVLPESYSKGWQVRRAEYDHELLQHTAEMGVEVRQATRVTQVLRDGDDRMTARVIGVECRDAKGTTTLNCSWLMDCTGQDALLGHDLDNRRYSASMNNYALYGYWSGYTWHEAFMGQPQLTRIFLATSQHGWFWCIPASDTILSIGLVTNREILNTMPGTAHDLYLSEIKTCPEVAAILDGAVLTKLSTNQNRGHFMQCRIGLTRVRRWWATGWAMAGDAAAFVDPILSSGVMVAHELGQKAAYTIQLGLCGCQRC